MDPTQESKLHSILAWGGWHRPIPDPGPDPWQHILEGLDKAALRQLASLQLEVSKATLQAQLNAIQRAQEIISKAAAK